MSMQKTLEAIGAQIDAYHDDHCTTTMLQVTVDNQEEMFTVTMVVPGTPGTLYTAKADGAGNYILTPAAAGETKELYRLNIATFDNLHFEFVDGLELARWFGEVNQGINPATAANARKRLEQLTIEQTKRVGEIEALQKTLGDMPDTQRIEDAKATAAEMIQRANAQLAVIEAERTELEAEAERRLAAVDAARAELELQRAKSNEESA